MHLHFGHLVRILHWCTDQSMTATLEQQELTASQGHIMGYLSRQTEAPCPRDIEAAFHLTHPTVSGILSRLEQKGFIQQRPDPNDRRCKRIYLSDKGLQCHDTMYRIILENEERMVQDFTQEEKELFLSFLHRAIANMGGGPCQHQTQEESQQ